MNARLEAIKWAALSAMVADHVGFALLPEVAWLRLLGRFTFVALLYVLAHRLTVEGRADRMFRRLMLWVPLAELAHVALVGLGQPFNVFVTLAGCAAVVSICEATVPRWWHLAHLAVAVSAVAWSEYRLAVLLAPLIVQALRFGGALVAAPLLALAAMVVNPWPLSWLMSSLAASLAVLAWPVSWRVEGRVPGWAFYAFYPAHMLVLALMV